MKNIYHIIGLILLNIFLIFYLSFFLLTNTFQIKSSFIESIIFLVIPFTMLILVSTSTILKIILPNYTKLIDCMLDILLVLILVFVLVLTIQNIQIQIPEHFRTLRLYD